MYLPQVTSGPSVGRLVARRDTSWCTRCRARSGASGSAPPRRPSSPTDPGYDYQPDWSPDGRHIVYTSYRNDALELWLLDLPDGSTGARRQRRRQPRSPLVARWEPRSPSSRPRTKVAGTSSCASPFASPTRRSACAPTAHRRHATARCRATTTAASITISRPTWSPDGKELILVSNRGHVWGSGRTLADGRAAPAAPMREIRKRGDQLEGAARLGPRRPAGRLQLLPRQPAEPALAHHRRRRRSVPADLLRLRPHARRAGRPTGGGSPS